MLDYRDIIYRLAGKGALERLGILYHSAIIFATNAPYRTHHWTLYSSVNWSSLYTHRKTHWLMRIYKTLFRPQSPLSEISTAALILHIQHPFWQSHSVKGPRSTHPWVAPLFSSLQLVTGTSCNKHSNWTVKSQSLHSKTQLWTLTESCGCFVWYIVVSTFLPFVMLSVPNNVCTLFCAATMCCCHVVLLPCAAAMLCCYHVVVMLCCYHAVLSCCVATMLCCCLGLSLCSDICLVVMCVLSYV